MAQPLAARSGSSTTHATVQRMQQKKSHNSRRSRKQQLSSLPSPLSSRPPASPAGTSTGPQHWNRDVFRKCCRGTGALRFARLTEAVFRSQRKRSDNHQRKSVIRRISTSHPGSLSRTVVITLQPRNRRSRHRNPGQSNAPHLLICLGMRDSRRPATTTFAMSKTGAAGGRDRAADESISRCTLPAQLDISRMHRTQPRGDLLHCWPRGLRTVG
jgi:hypothetical protein